MEQMPPEEEELSTRRGAIIQVMPGTVSRFSGCLCIVTEVKDWGVIAFVMAPSSEPVHPRFYTRLRWDEFDIVGPAPWLPDDMLDVDPV